MVDKPLILRKLSKLDEYLKQMREFSSVTFEEYLRDWKVQRIVERTLQMMIETCADIANHIISDRGYRIPNNYGDTFRVLHENSVLKKDLFEIMVKMARFRNIVVHQYDKVDESIVIEILKNHLNDFEAYRDTIIRIIG